MSLKAVQVKNRSGSDFGLKSKLKGVQGLKGLRSGVEK